VQITLDPGQVLRRGEKNNHIYLAQSMLTVLHLLDSRLPAPPHSGVLDPATAESVAAFQTVAGLPPTGEIDKRTWKDLALYYALAADRLENEADL
jgi:murein L,D-transpeptidase YcbB/YkuD